MDKDARDAIFPVLGSFMTGLSMMIGIWMRDIFKRRSKQTTAEIAEERENRTQMIQLKKEREEYKDKWTSCEMQRLLLENEIKHLLEDKTRLQNEIDERRRKL